jgi:ubiquinone/menaquinone biosynthesis C-methylase UbiE
MPAELAGRSSPRLAWAPVPPDASLRLGELIAAAARDYARTSPPPRGAPFFGLDHRSGSALALLGSLASHGIFRKYERVLDLSAHLGMSSRWLAAVLGCTAVATAASAAEALAGGALTRAAALEEHVQHVAADPATLPFDDGAFTHVWSVEALAFLNDPAAGIAEAHRVLRPGGHLAIQELVRADSGGPAIAGATFRGAEAWMRVLARAGFVDLTVRDVSARASETVALLTTARRRLEGTLDVAARHDSALATVARRRIALSACLATRTLGLIQILGRRP